MTTAYDEMQSRQKMTEIVTYLSNRMYNYLDSIRTSVTSQMDDFANRITEEDEEDRSARISPFSKAFNEFRDIIDPSNQGLVYFYQGCVEDKVTNIKLFIDAYYFFLATHFKSRAQFLVESERLFVSEEEISGNQFIYSYNAILTHVTGFMVNEQQEAKRCFEKNGIHSILDYHIIIPKGFFIFDVESIGVHGQAFAFAYMKQNPYGQVDEVKGYYCDPALAKGTDEDRDWVMKNVFSTFTNKKWAHRLERVKTRRALLKKLKAVWEESKDQYTMVVDHGYPVETTILKEAKCQVYPLIDVSSMLVTVGKDPIASYTRYPNELPVHHPIADVMQTSRIFKQILNMEVKELIYHDAHDESTISVHNN